MKQIAAEPQPLRAFLLTAALAAALMVGVGTVRVSQQFPAAAETPNLLLPFLSPVLALAIEVAVLVALPLAASLRSAGASRLTLLAVLSAALLVGAELAPRGAERPGAFINELVERGRSACGSGRTKVMVPLIGLEWQCRREPIALEGRVGGAVVGARQLRFSEDLRRVEVAGLTLRASRFLNVKLSAARATVTGLPLWSRPASLPAALRWGLLFATAFGLALAWSRLPPLSRRPGITALRIVPGALAAVALVLLDQSGATALAYCVPAVAGGAALLGLAQLGRYRAELFM